jgi:exopolysaccharide biosynthesis predicted pyruvyltransferase EpsI
MPGNIGDHLIWAGTQRLLKDQDINFDCTNVKDVLGGSLNHTDSTLVIPGNAAMTSRWNEWLPATVIVAASHFNKVIVLPSEYEPEVEIVHRALSLKNVFALAREVGSYKSIKHYGRAGIAIDPALYAFDFNAPRDPNRSDNDLGTELIALRDDSGSILPSKNLVPTQLNNDISLTCQNLDEFLHKVNQSDTVITDRLHVAVAGLMLGKTVRYVDPYNQKISRYAKFNFRDEFSMIFQKRDESWLLQRGYVERIIS